MRQLEKDKVELQGQLRDLEWRLDNESKVCCDSLYVVGIHWINNLWKDDFSCCQILYIHADLLRNLTPVFVGDGVSSIQLPIKYY